MEKYEIKKVVGEGSYGKAILCKRKADSKLCIIKQISIKKLSKKEALLTEQEATLLKRLQHPNIVTFWESFFGNNNLHIVMEYADGGDLDHYIKAHAKSVPRREIPEKQVVNMFVQLSLAIKHIHDRKILHRDLKSQNVFLTSTGQLKLGDFGVSRVLRHTVELAATQIGTPYYMSPEIMENQRYNSKTDIWSLGCILYELMCLRLPFDGSSMKQLCYNIVKVNPVSPSLVYSAELRELVRDTLHKNPKTRPGINSILSRPIMRSKISALLGETKRQAEFCHTVLHGANVLSSQVQPAPPIAPMPQLSAQQAQAYRQVAPPPAPAPVVSALQRPSSANGAGAYAAYAAAGAGAGRPSGAAAAYQAAGPLRGPPVVPSSAAAQAVAMLQAQRQQQLLRQQQQQAQQQQYVGAMAAQMKAQIEITRQAEAARARAQQKQQQEGEQRRVRQQAEARVRDQQQQLVRAAEAQKQFEKQRAADEQMDKQRRAVALLEQQKALERRRQERMAEEARKIREEERVRMKAQAAQAAQAQARAAARSPASALEGGGGAARAGGGGGGAVVVHAPPAIARRPSMKPPIPANVPSSQQPAPAPVRQFSAAALLAKRRHSAPEKPPSAYAVVPKPAAAPASATPPAPTPAAVPTRAPVVTTAAALRAKAAGNVSPAPVSGAAGAGADVAPANPFKAVVDTRSTDKDKAIPPPWMKRNTPSPTPELSVVGASRASLQQPSPSASPRPSVQPSPVPSNCKESSRPPPYVRDASQSSVAAAGIASPKPAPFSPTPASPNPAGFSPYERRVAVDSALSKVQDVMQAVQGLNMKGRRVDADNSHCCNSSDSSSSYGSILPPTPSTAAPVTAASTPVVPKDARVSNVATAAGAAAAKEGDNVSSGSGASSPWLSDLMGQMGQLKNQMQNLQQLRSPSVAASPHSIDVDDDYLNDNNNDEGEEDGSYTSSMSSITTANTPVSRDYGNYHNNNKGPISVPKQAQPPHHNNPHHSHSQVAKKVSSQRTSYPLSAESSTKRNMLVVEPEGFPSDNDMQPSSSKDSLASRKESRARQQQDFRAFVQAQKKIHCPADDATDDSAYTAAAAAQTAETQQAAGAIRGGKLPAFTPQSQRADHHGRHGGDVSEHGSLASVSSYSVPHSSQEDSQSSSEYPQKPPSNALQIKVPHLHGHAHNHKIKPTAEIPPAARKSSAAAKDSGANKGKATGPSSLSSQVPQRKGVSGAGSVASSARSSPASGCSPRNTPAAAAGFNVEEFRSQREAERKEMRQLMQDRRKQLHAQRGADNTLPATPVCGNDHTEDGYSCLEEGSEDAEIAVLVPAKPPKQQYHFEPSSPQKASPRRDVDTSMTASLKYTLDTAAAAARGNNVDDSYEQSRIFAHLETGTQAVQAAVDHPALYAEEELEGDLDEEEEELLLEQAFAQQLLDEQAGSDELGLTASNDFEYSVLIEQMQQILRKPSVILAGKAHTHAHTHHHKPALGSIAEEEGSAHKKLSPGRALAGELMFEGDDEDEEEEEKDEIDQKDMTQEGGDDIEVEVEVEDPDEFEEEELMILEDLPDNDNDININGYEKGTEGQDGYANEGYCEGDSSASEADVDDDHADGEGDGDAFCADSDFDSDCEGVDGGGVVDYSASHDPFLLPLMPALLTADMALLDPLRHHFGAQQQPSSAVQANANGGTGAGAGTVESAKFSTPDRAARKSHPHSHAHALAHERTPGTATKTDTIPTTITTNAADVARRRLQVAELQEYLVEKLGSAKVSEALHLLSVSTEATMLAPPGTGSPSERSDNYYDERDEELLNRIEDILGVDCLHYLDDMFTLLTLQQ